MRTGRLAVLALALCGLLLRAPTARAWPGHGVSIQKTCVGPDGTTKARAGDTITCRITVANQDTLGDTLRVDDIVDVVNDASGPTTTPELLQDNFGLECVLLMPAQAVTVVHQFTAGDPENDPLPTAGTATGADLRDAGAAFGSGCPAGGLAFEVTFGAQVDIVECFDDPECDAGSPCSLDRCESNACVHDPAPPGTVCRSSEGKCDPAEECDGLVCPDDVRSTALCRSAAGVCDVAESCNGIDPDCPADAFVASAVVCRSAAGVCDVDERCTGGGPACPGDGLVAYGTVCRSAAGVCDAVEKCTGSGVGCPTDVKKTGVCRPSVDDCDVPDACNGGNDCPPDAVAPSTISCRAAAGPCDLREYCTGTSPTCPGDLRKPVGTVCRSAVGTCDMDEVCNGGVACPADVVKALGTACPDDGGPCSLDVCNGASPLCTHPAGNAGAPCRVADPSKPCDQVEVCPGSSVTCPADGSKAIGTSCNADGDVCTEDRCDASGACVVTGASNDPTCGVCGERATGVCAVTVDGVAGVFTSLQAAVDAAPNGGVIHVTGVCKGLTLIKKRTALTIEGPAPSQCPPGPNDLTATLQHDPAATPLSGSTGEVVKVLSSNNITVRYLNIVNGDEHDGLEFKSSASGTAYCNCVAKNDEGFELDYPGGHVASRNLVTRNSGAGIDLHNEQTASRVVENRIEKNGEEGVRVNEESHHNELSGNLCRDNGLSGILLDDADGNYVVGNDVHHNGLAGIRLEGGADGNTIGSSTAPNLIHDNGDALTNMVLCVGDLAANVGTNVPATPACQ